MVSYGVVWHPRSDNLGDDLQALAALQQTPRVDHVLDGEGLDKPIPGLGQEDRVVTLLSGNVFRMPAHWPPESHIVPVCVGMHFSGEDVWGVHLPELDGVGLRYLTSCAPIGCRDADTASLMAQMGVPHELTACLTLTLEKPDLPEDAGRYVCCVDVPDTVISALKLASAGTEVRVMTHQRQGDEQDFTRRMDGARALLQAYAGAAFVVTRRLHCAMACLAIGTPVLLLYNSGYEDVSRFAPMDGMLRVQPVEDFTAQVKHSGWPDVPPNDDAVLPWREKLLAWVADGLAKAAQRPMCLISPEEAEAWRRACLEKMADSAAEKIHRLELEQYESLHEKFTLILKEDSVKSAMTDLMNEPEVILALQKASRRRYLMLLPWYRRFGAWRRFRRQTSAPEGYEELHRIATEQLARLGWPEKRTPH